MSRTKVVATYGPACESDRVLVAMMRAGMDVLRLNVSHLEPGNLVAVTRRIRALAGSAGIPLAILADMPGPKIRCTACNPEHFDLRDGQRVDLAPGTALSTPQCIRIPYRRLLDDVAVRHEVAINDGLVLLRVEKVDRKAGALRCVVLRGGPVSSRKGVCFLQSSLRITGLTPRDREGLQAAAEAPADFIALSFVRSGRDIRAARRVLKRAGAPGIPIVAKIEQHEALDNIAGILRETDGVMVARGDMGIEKPLEQVPLLQKDLIRRCNETGRFVITATQMLESMTEHARPTRAEVSDVANAILDGTDAVMLSGETAAGKYPAAAVETMARVALAAEQRIDANERLLRLAPSPGMAAGGVPSLDDALAHAACRLAITAQLDALVCLSFYGSTARRIARYRPRCPIYVLSPYEEHSRRLAITWGVEVFAFPEAKPGHGGKTPSPGELITPAIAVLRRAKRLKSAHRIAILAGIPLDSPGGTNWLRVVEI